MKLEGKVALVTGSGRGIGRAIALRLAGLGADIAVSDIRLDSAQEYDEVLTAATVMDEVKALGRRSIGIETDVTNKKMVSQMFDRIIAEFGHIDILVNNVGGIRAKRGELSRDSADINEDDMREIMNKNLTATMFCCQAVIPRMLAQKSGIIVNIASILGVAMLTPSNSALGPSGIYGAAKAGIIQYSRVLAAELGPHGIRINCVAPGLIATSRQLARAREGATQPTEMLKAVPLGRVGQPEDVARVAEFLCTDLSDYVTGQVIRVDGGRTLF